MLGRTATLARRLFRRSRRASARRQEGRSKTLGDTPASAGPWRIDHCRRATDYSGRESCPDRKSVVEGKSVSVSVDLGCRSIYKKKNIKSTSQISRYNMKK